MRASGVEALVDIGGALWLISGTVEDGSMGDMGAWNSTAPSSALDARAKEGGVKLQPWPKGWMEALRDLRVRGCNDHIRRLAHTAWDAQHA